MSAVLDSVALRQAMVDRLVDAGELGSAWEPAMRAVPRHAFLPDQIWWRDPSIPGPHDYVPLNRLEQPNRWLGMAYADAPVITQVDDGTPTGAADHGERASSSASMPLLVARMLTALQAAPGHRVLEIGTGTGYNAALLAHRLGMENVTSIEVDSAVAERARGALRETGYGDVLVVRGDGARGHEGRAPYDRIISTASVRRVPYQWVRETAPSGRIITPWAHPYLPVLLAFSVTREGVAVGHVADPGMDFMILRAQRRPGLSVSEILDGQDPERGTASTTGLHPYHVVGDWDAAFAIGQRVPDCQQRYFPPDEDDGLGTQWLLDPRSRSWSRVRFDPAREEDTYPVRQGGPRRLWDEVEAAYRWWNDHGRPAARDWRIEVSATRRRVTLPTVERNAGSDTGAPSVDAVRTP